MKEFFQKKENLIKLGVIVAGSLVLAWSLVALFRSSEYQNDLYSANEEYAEPEAGAAQPEALPAEGGNSQAPAAAAQPAASDVK